LGSLIVNPMQHAPTSLQSLRSLLSKSEPGINLVVSRRRHASEHGVSARLQKSVFHQKRLADHPVK
jgi:hypothetical protein